MPTNPDTAIATLLDRGRAAAQAGDTLGARTAFRAAAEQDEQCAEAWLGLADATTVLGERRSYLLRATALRPDEASLAALAVVEQQIGSGLVLVPSAAPQAPAPAQPSLAALTGSPRSCSGGM